MSSNRKLVTHGIVECIISRKNLIVQLNELVEFFEFAQISDIVKKRLISPRLF